MRYTIIHRDDDFSKEFTKNLHTALRFINFEENQEHPQLIITVGGDGTMLHAIHQYIDKLKEVSFVGIHTGTLGFFTDYTCDELDEFLADILKQPTFREHPLIETKCYGDTGLRHHVYALNESRVENIIQTQLIKVYINDEFFENFRGNGMCISAQLGSTAYNRSINGAIIDSRLQALQLTEISGIHHRHYRSLNSPLVLHFDTVITLQSESFEGAMLIYDYLNINLHQTKCIEVKLSDKIVKFATFKKVSYYNRLRSLF